MPDTAYQRKYRSEFIAGFEKRQSLLRHSVTTEAEVNGNEAIFLVADSGGATAVTRGVNGDIPTRPDNLNQYTATLKEWHDVPERTNFNIYASQGNGRRIMQETSMAVINRKIDDDIHDALDAATLTNDLTAASTAAAFFKEIRESKAVIRQNHAGQRGMLFAAITPAFHENLMVLDQFTSVDYIKDQKFDGAALSDAFNWSGVNWIVDDELPGVGTSAAKCFLYHKAAIGHACDMTRVHTHVGYDEKNDKSWARCSAYLGSKLIQSSGVIELSHDDTNII